MTSAAAPWPPNPPKASMFDIGVIGFWLLVFATLSFATSIMLSGSGTEAARFTLRDGQISQPFTTERANEIVTVSVHQDVAVQNWSYPEVQVLDDDQDYLFSFGDEMWYETGYDDEGQWSESNTWFALDFVLPDPGTYHLGLELEGYDSPVSVTVGKGAYSKVPHFVAGLLALAAGAVLVWMANGRLFGSGSGSGSGDDDDE